MNAVVKPPTREQMQQQIAWLERENERLKEQCKGLAQSAMNNGQDLLLKECEIERLRAALTDLLMLDKPHEGVTLEYLTPAASLRRQADALDRRETVIQRAWELVRRNEQTKP